MISRRQGGNEEVYIFPYSEEVSDEVDKEST
jgi:hypothetical protein